MRETITMTILIISVSLMLIFGLYRGEIPKPTYNIGDKVLIDFSGTQYIYICQGVGEIMSRWYMSGFIFKGDWEYNISVVCDGKVRGFVRTEDYIKMAETK